MANIYYIQVVHSEQKPLLNKWHFLFLQKALKPYIEKKPSSLQTTFPCIAQKWIFPFLTLYYVRAGIVDAIIPQIQWIKQNQSEYLLGHKDIAYFMGGHIRGQRGANEENWFGVG